MEVLKCRWLVKERTNERKTKLEKNNYEVIIGK
jgi:hypothetical protein